MIARRHAFITEEHMVAGMELALERDRRLAAGQVVYTEAIANVPPKTIAPTDFSECASCVANGFGWSLQKNKCGRFANQRCPEL